MERRSRKWFEIVLIKQVYFKKGPNFKENLFPQRSLPEEADKTKYVMGREM